MQRAQRRKYHYIYKTTCIITNKFYIGMHSTDNLEDGYVGSGKRLWYSINKHGKENHVCQILEFLPDRDSLREREKEVVNQEMLNEELCMNLAIGGEGGHGSKFLTKEQLSNGGKNSMKVIWTSEKRIQHAKKQKEIYLKLHSEGKLHIPTFKDKTHSLESKRLIGEANSIKQKGVNNSQYGKCWITNDVDSIKINKGDSIPEGWRLGRKLKL